MSGKRGEERERVKSEESREERERKELRLARLIPASMVMNPERGGMERSEGGREWRETNRGCDEMKLRTSFLGSPSGEGRHTALASEECFCGVTDCFLRVEIKTRCARK